MIRKTDTPRTYIKYELTRQEFCDILGIDPADGEPMGVDVNFRTDIITITMNKVYHRDR